ncbi:hypothetical protein ACLOJK_003702 [Asimina triloba]
MQGFEGGAFPSNKPTKQTADYMEEELIQHKHPCRLSFISPQAQRSWGSESGVHVSLGARIEVGTVGGELVVLALQHWRRRDSLIILISR